MNDSQPDRENRHDMQRLRRRAAGISLAIGVLMFGMKGGAYLVTGSAAILSDAMESVVHVVATAVAFYSVILVGRPADQRHPYGYGKAEYFSAGLEGALIVIAAIAIVYEAVNDIIRGPALEALDVGVLVIAGAGGINLALGLWLIRIGKRTNSLVLVADGKHVLTDSYTSIGVLVGLILVLITGITVLDPLFAIGVALNIIVTGYRLVEESVRGLMNVADPDTIERVVRVMNRIREPEMIDMHRLRAWSAGEKRFVDFHLTLPYYLNLEQTHQIQHRVEDAIREEFDGQAEILIHLDPCRDARCVVCEKTDCTERSHAGFRHEEITVESAMGEPRLRNDSG